jgi:hypothetical protein
MHPIAKSYGYTPTWFDWLTGYDYGVDKCLRSGSDAYLCYTQYLRQVRDNIGWTPQLVNTLIVSAEPKSKGSATQFWKSVESNFLKWVKLAGYHPDDLPKFDKVLKVMDSFSDSAFSYDEIQKQKEQFFSDLYKETQDDAWESVKQFWKQLPTGVKIGAVSIVGLYTLTQIATIAKLLTNDQ